MDRIRRVLGARSNKTLPAAQPPKVPSTAVVSPVVDRVESPRGALFDEATSIRVAAIDGTQKVTSGSGSLDQNKKMKLVGVAINKKIEEKEAEIKRDISKRGLVLDIPPGIRVADCSYYTTVDKHGKIEGEWVNIKVKTDDVLLGNNGSGDAVYAYDWARHLDKAIDDKRKVKVIKGENGEFTLSCPYDYFTKDDVGAINKPEMSKIVRKFTSVLFEAVNHCYVAITDATTFYKYTPKERPDPTTPIAIARRVAASSRDDLSAAAAAASAPASLPGTVDSPGDPVSRVLGGATAYSSTQPSRRPSALGKSTLPPKLPSRPSDALVAVAVDDYSDSEFHDDDSTSPAAAGDGRPSDLRASARGAPKTPRRPIASVAPATIVYAPPPAHDNRKVLGGSEVDVGAVAGMVLELEKEYQRELKDLEIAKLTGQHKQANALLQKMLVKAKGISEKDISERREKVKALELELEKARLSEAQGEDKAGRAAELKKAAQRLAAEKGAAAAPQTIKPATTNTFEFSVYDLAHIVAGKDPMVEKAKVEVENASTASRSVVDLSSTVFSLRSGLSSVATPTSQASSGRSSRFSYNRSSATSSVGAAKASKPSIVSILGPRPSSIMRPQAAESLESSVLGIGGGSISTF